MNVTVSNTQEVKDFGEVKTTLMVSRAQGIRNVPS